MKPVGVSSLPLLAVAYHGDWAVLPFHHQFQPTRLMGLTQGLMIEFPTHRNHVVETTLAVVFHHFLVFYGCGFPTQSAGYLVIAHGCSGGGIDQGADFIDAGGLGIEFLPENAVAHASPYPVGLSGMVGIDQLLVGVGITELYAGD